MHFFDFYIIPGLVIGCIYAIAASGIVMAYSTSGVLNIGYGSMAFTLALVFYELRSNHHILSGWPAFLLCVIVIGPLLGVFLWQAIFRWLVPLGLDATLIASIGITIALPALCELVFVPGQIFYSPGVPNNGTSLHRIGSIVFSVDQAYAVCAAVLVAAALFYLLRFTATGLRMRAVFDSRSVASLTGTSPAVASNLSWAISGALAAVGGIFLAPLLTLDTNSFLRLTVASLAAALVGGLRSIAIAFIAALLIGVGSSAITGVDSSSTLLSMGVQPSLPFLVMVAVVFVRRSAIDIGGVPRRTIELAERFDGVGPWLAKVLPGAVLIGIAPLVLNTYWTGVVGLGLVYGVIFLGFTIALGFGGILPLGQAAIVGIGAFAAGDLATTSGVPLLLAVVIGALIAAGVSFVLALVGRGLNRLEFGLLTLGFGLFTDYFLYNWTTLVPLAGVTYPEPVFLGLHLTSASQQYYLFAVVLALALLLVAWYRRRLVALFVGAGRQQPALAAATGANPRTTRIIAFVFAAFIAAVGGGLLGVYQKQLAAGGTDFLTLTGLTWLAVVVFMGIRSPAAAVAGGIVFAVMPALFAEWLPVSWGPLPIVLFGLGALTLAQNPRGAVEAQKVQIAWLANRVRRRPRGSPA
jgi:branched-chain amino acid transport system permease protein